jgi:hypothetical protein
MDLEGFSSKSSFKFNFNVFSDGFTSFFVSGMFKPKPTVLFPPKPVLMPVADYFLFKGGLIFLMDV